MSKTILIDKKGKFFEVSDEDYDFIIQLKNLNFSSNQVTAHIAGSRLYLNRIVAERSGQDICKKHVHHIDGNSLNNKRDNLIALSPADHMRLHYLMRSEPGFDIKNFKRFESSGAVRKLIDLNCAQCGKKFKRDSLIHESRMKTSTTGLYFCSHPCSSSYRRKSTR